METFWERDVQGQSYVLMQGHALPVSVLYAYGQTTHLQCKPRLRSGEQANKNTCLQPWFYHSDTAIEVNPSSPEGMGCVVCISMK
eukprot:m.47408 g.47408  ORF g.47408 m.47408 type:complete len:85 (-) comp10977_c2_seq1:91-345(-)